MLDYALPRASWLPSVRARRDRDPVAGQPARRQGRRRGGLHREHRGGGQRGHRRAEPAGHPAPRHAVHRAEGVGRDPGARREARHDPGGVRVHPGGQRRRGAGRHRRRRRGEGHRGRPEPPAAAQAAAGVASRRSSTSGGSTSSAAIERLDDGRLSVGALTTYAELMDSPAIHYGAAAATPCRRSATSRSATAGPSAAPSPTPTRRRTSRPSLLALDAEVVLQSSRRRRGRSRPTASSRGRSRPRCATTSS